MKAENLLTAMLATIIQAGDTKLVKVGSLAVALLFTIPRAHAAGTDTWVGNTDTNWNTAANWTTSGGSTPPANGDSLVFGAAGSSGTSLNNNISGLKLNKLTFNSGASAFTFSGNGITLGTGGIDASALTSGTMTFNFTNFIGNGVQRWNVGAGATLAFGKLGAGADAADTYTPNGAIVFISKTGTKTTTTADGWGWRSGAVANTGVLGPGMVIDNGDNTYDWASAGASGGSIVAATYTTAVNGDAHNVKVTGNTTVSPNASWVSLLVSNATLTHNGSHLYLDTGIILENGGVVAGSGPIHANADGLYVYTPDNGTISASIQNNGANVKMLHKAGSGVLTLSGANTYSGATTIYEGTLTIGGAGQLGGGSYSGALTNNGAFVYNSSASQTLAGGITGSGSLTKSGVSTLTLSGSNSYTGGTTISNGILAVGNNAALGTGPATMAGGALQNNGVRTIPNNIVVAANTINFFNLSASPGENLTLQGNLTGSGAFTRQGGTGASLYMNGDNSAFAGVFSNSTGVTRLNTNAAGSANAYWVANASFSFDDASGGNIYLGALGGSSGSATLGGNVSGGASFTLVVGGLNTNSTFAGVIANDNGWTGNSIGLVKTGSGAQTLSGANTFTGDTTIEAGTLALAGSGSMESGVIDIRSNARFDVSGTTAGSFTLASGRSLTNSGAVSGGLIVGSGAHVSGGGSFAGPVTNQSGGFLSPGAGGHTNFFASLTLDGGSTNSFHIGPTYATHDMSVVTNSLSGNGSSPLLRLDLGDYTWNPADQGQVIVLYDDLSGGPSGFDGSSSYFVLSDPGAGALSDGLVLTEGTSFYATGNGSVSNAFMIHYNYDVGSQTLGTGNDVVVAVIPEPASVSLLLLLGSACLLRRRIRGSRAR